MSDTPSIVDLARSVIDDAKVMARDRETPCCENCDDAPALATEVLRVHEPDAGTVERVARALGCTRYAHWVQIAMANGQTFGSTNRQTFASTAPVTPEPPICAAHEAQARTALAALAQP